MRTDEQGVEWVTVRHTGSNGVAEVTKEAFDTVYKDKGWVVEDKHVDAEGRPVEFVEVASGEPDVPVGSGAVAQEAAAAEAVTKRERKEQ